MPYHPVGGVLSTLQLTGPKIGERLMAEAESNLSIGVLPTAGQDAYEVQGRGELQLGKYKVECCESCIIQDPGCYAVLSLIVNTCRAGILLENMRREGFELSVSPPAVM